MATGAGVSHFEAVSEDLPLIIYAETNPIYDRMDNINHRLSWMVDVHFYTHTEFDPMFEQLEGLFNEHNIPFDVESVDYGRYKDGRDGVFYYKFVCEV
jgi:hypothetical protein